MEEQLITFKTAKLAKERGFFEGFRLYTMEGKLWQTFFIGEEERKQYSASTQSLLQKWLRDVHKINVHVYSVHGHDGSEFQLRWSADVYNMKELNDENYHIMIGYELSDGIKDTFEEALEMGLDAALRIEMLWKNN